MSVKRLSVRFDLSIESQRNAWEFIHRRGADSLNKEIVDCILLAKDRTLTEERLQKLLRETVQGMPLLSQPVAEQTDDGEIDALLDFLESF